MTTSAGDVDPDDLDAMIAMLRHRGPDESGVHVEPCAGLAHARLSIIDLSGGYQPMANDDGTIWLTFNGEIFNYVELRNELVARGCRFRGHSDTEVLLRLYEYEGADAVKKLNGQWAFAIWDSRTRTLLMSRDPLGVRPLFYTTAGQSLIFASEVKALFAHPRVERGIDLAGLDNIFTFWTPHAPRSVFRNVAELPPGHSLIWRGGRHTVEAYWQPWYAPAASGERSEESYRDELEALLTDATRVRLRSDVPVGAYLSGGLDSSIVSSLITRIHDAPLRTFSISFDHAEFDESRHQLQVAKALQTQHSDLRCSDADIAQAFPDMVWHTEQPLMRTAPVPLYLLSRFVKSHGYKVVLTGEGADEVLGGYDIFKEAKVRRFWARVPDSRWRASLIERLYPYLPELQRQPLAYRQAFFHVRPQDVDSPFFSHLPRWTLTSRLKMFFSDAVRDALRGHDAQSDVAMRLPSDFDSWDPFCRAQYLETILLLPGYILSAQGDRAAMAHGVEARHPFLDPRVVAFAATLPPTLKMKALNEKHLLKRVAERVVPSPVWERSKQPYRAPEGRVFFAGRMREYVGDLLSPSQLKRDGLFQPQAVAALLAKFRSGNAVSTKDNMAITAIVSTALLVDRFVNNFQKVAHGHRDERVA